MKNKLRTNVLFSILLLSVLVFFAACNKDDDNQPDNTTDFTATINGNQETPPVTTTGSGTFTGTYNSTTRVLSYTLTWTGLTGPPTGMHFHNAPVGESGGVVIPITDYTVAAAGTLTTTATVDEDLEDELMGGLLYVNIHTDMYPGGEIRGQVLKQ